MTFEEYKVHLRNPAREQVYKIEWMDKDENVTDELITSLIDGSISLQVNNGIRRNCNITFSNASGLFTPNPNGYIYIDKKFKLYSGLRVNGVNYFIDECVQGIFNLGNPILRHDSSSNTVSLEAYDNFALLNGTLSGQLDVAVWKVPVESVVTDVIADTLLEAGITTPPLMDTNSTVTPYTLTKEAGNTFGDILTDIASMVSWDIFFNKYGTPVFRPPTDEVNDGHVWEFNTNEVSYINSEHTYNYLDVRNHIMVYGDNINGDLATGEAEDTNIFSPTNINKIGRRTKVITDTMIHTDSLAQDRADYELRMAIEAYEYVNLKTINLDFINEGDIILIRDTDADFDGSRYLVNQIDRSLSNNSEMSIQAWKVRGIS